MTLQKLVEDILATDDLNRRLDDPDWQSFVLVLTFNDGEMLRTSGRVFYSDGREVGSSVRPRLIKGVAEAYERSIRPPSGEGMKCMLIQYNRDTGQVRAEYEYDDAMRWRVTPSNLDVASDALRPIWD